MSDEYFAQVPFTPYVIGDRSQLQVDKEYVLQQFFGKLSRGLQLSQLTSQWTGTATGTANALTLTSTPVTTAYTAGQVFRFKAAATNTGASTAAVSGLVARAVQINGVALVGGEIVINQWYELWNDGAAFQLKDITTFLQAGIGAGVRPAQNKLREIVSVKDFGAVGDGVTDDTAAIQAAQTALVLRGGGTLWFPLGIYAVSDTIQFSATTAVLPITWVGEGNPNGSTPYGTRIKWIGATDADTAVVKALGTISGGYTGCGIENLSIDADSKAGYDLWLDAWTGGSVAQKQWTCRRVGFVGATRACVVIGDAAFSAGDFVVTTTKDADCHLNLFERCLFNSTATQLYGVVINVTGNAYQTTFRDSSFEGTGATLAAMVNYIYSLSGNSTEVHNTYFPPMPSQGSNTYCMRQFCGSLLVMGGGSEEGRVLKRLNLAAAFNATTIIGFNVNDPNDMDDASKKKSIDCVSGSPMLLLNNKFNSGSVSREIKSASSNFTAIGNQVGAAAVWTNCAPSDGFISRTFDAAHYTASGSMTWTLTSGDVLFLVYSIMGTHMWVKWHLINTTLGGVANTALQILIPAGKASAKAFTRPFTYFNNGAEAFGVAAVSDGGTVISLFKSYYATANWTLETNATHVFGDIDFEIDP